MSPRVRILIWSPIAGMTFTAVSIALANSGFYYSAFLLLPGIYASALLFPEGVHSDWPNAYLALAIAINTIFYACLTAALWMFARRGKGR